MKKKKWINWLWKSVEGQKSPILLNSIVGILRVCTGLLFVFICKRLIDIATHTIDGDLTLNTIFLISIVCVELIFSAWSNRIENRNEIRIKNKLKYQLFTHTMLSIWDGKEHFHSGDIINRLEEDVRLISDALSKTVPSIFVGFFQLIAAFIFLAQLDIRMAYIIMLIMPLFLLLSKIYMNKMRRLTNEIRSTDSSIQSLIQENIQHKVLIQTLEQNKAVNSKLSFLQNILYGQTLKRINFMLFSRTFVIAGFISGYVAAFIWGVNGIYQGLITFGTMTAFLQLVGQVQRPIVDLSKYVPSLFQVIASIKRLMELEAVEPEIQGEAIVLEGEIGLQFEHISFSYSDSDKAVIEDFSFNFTPCSKTAIVGETGAGKSTLIRMALALLKPQQGNIYLYNKNQKIAVSPLTRSNMVYVPQGNTLLSGTIRDNLLLGNPNASDADIDKVLKIAAAEFVYKLPLGLDTLCGEQGKGLSEGQAQRICIARGLLRPGKLLLLDEFSSSLDQTTERLLIERLMSETQDKTIIFITHREMITEYCKEVINIKKVES